MSLSPQYLIPSLAFLLTSACISDASVCEDAEEHLRECGAELPADTVCDSAAAESVLEQSCDDLRGDGPKSDGLCTIFTPWNCFPEPSAGNRIEVALNECIGSFGDTCSAVRSLSCGEVILETPEGTEVARGFASQSGRLTFPEVDRGDYVVKAVDRSGALVTTDVGDLLPSFVPSALPIKVEDDETWVRFNVPSGHRSIMTWCSRLRMDFTATDSGGVTLDAEETEWNWFIVFTREGDTEHSQVTRPLSFFNGEGNPKLNSFSFSELFPGKHRLDFVRMDIPEHRQ